jgi:hypothetical protein
VIRTKAENKLIPEQKKISEQQTKKYLNRESKIRLESLNSRWREISILKVNKQKTTQSLKNKQLIENLHLSDENRNSMSPK